MPVDTTYVCGESTGFGCGRPSRMSEPMMAVFMAPDDPPDDIVFFHYGCEPVGLTRSVWEERWIAERRRAGLGPDDPWPDPAPDPLWPLPPLRAASTVVAGDRVLIDDVWHTVVDHKPSQEVPGTWLVVKSPRGPERQVHFRPHDLMRWRGYGRRR